MREKGRGGNRGFGDALADTYGDAASSPPAKPALPTDSVLTSRATSLGELATGKLVSERTMWVDPARCRPWPHHNRDQAVLDPLTCHDLITSFKAEGAQRIPAIVRRLKDDPAYDFEIIAGVRRHWTVIYLRDHNYPEFEFLVTIKVLTDEEAFRLADVENRARLDLTDLERAKDYAKALDLFYDGRQIDMAARLNIPPAWLSRLLELARLPDVILDCFANRSDLRVEHAKQLGPLLKVATKARRLLSEAHELASQQRDAGAVTITPAEVVRRLQRAAEDRQKKAKSPHELVQSPDHKPMIRTEKRRKGLFLEVLAGSGASRADLLAAISTILDRYPETCPFG